jgi:hypothetical protein
MSTMVPKLCRRQDPRCVVDGTRAATAMGPEEQGLESGKKVLEAFVTRTRVNRVEPRLSGIGKLYWAAFTDILIVLRRIKKP